MCDLADALDRMVQDAGDRHRWHLEFAQAGCDRPPDVAHLQVANPRCLADALNRLLRAEQISVDVRARATRTPARKDVVAVGGKGLEQLKDSDSLGRQRND